MANLAIKGHATRGKEVIEILEMLGGKNSTKLVGRASSCGYYIDSDGNIAYHYYSSSYFNDAIQFTLEEFFEKYPYKVGDRVQSKGNALDSEIYIIKSMEWNNFIGQIYYTIKTIDGIVNQYKWIAQEFMFHKEETMEENTDTTLSIDLKLKGEDYSDKRFCYKIPNGYEIDCVKNNEIILKPIKPQYPKTYEKCCDILYIETSRIIEYDDCLGYRDITQYDINLLTQLRCFRKLLICRDAYWKIAGEQTGLGKPWKPQFENCSIPHYCIFINHIGEIYDDCFYGSRCLLAFPTEEMRDAFLENFKELIELCKELL